MPSFHLVGRRAVADVRASYAWERHFTMPPQGVELSVCMVTWLLFRMNPTRRQRNVVCYDPNNCQAFLAVVVHHALGMCSRVWAKSTTISAAPQFQQYRPRQIALSAVACQ